MRDAGAAEAALRCTRAPMLSPGVVRVPDAAPAFAEGTLAQDPDGHEIALVK